MLKDEILEKKAEEFEMDLSEEVKCFVCGFLYPKKDMVPVKIDGGENGFVCECCYGRE